MNMQISSSVQARARCCAASPSIPSASAPSWEPLPTGVAVIATEWEGELFGATINSLTSVSLAPCMLLVLHQRGQRDWDGYPQTGLLLGEHSWRTSIRSVRPLHGEHRRTDLRILPLRSAPDGLPLLQGAAAQLCCRVAAVHKAGDHDIILGEVFSGEEIACSPLVFHKGAYGSFQRVSRLAAE